MSLVFVLAGSVLVRLAEPTHIHNNDIIRLFISRLAHTSKSVYLELLNPLCINLNAKLDSFPTKGLKGI